MSFHGWEQVEAEQVIALLKRLQELFVSEERWMSWPLAENKDSIEVSPSDPTATKFCLMGACQVLSEKAHAKPLSDFVDCATREFLDDLSGNELIKGKYSWAEEMTLIELGLAELIKENANEETVK